MCTKLYLSALIFKAFVHLGLLKIANKKLQSFICFDYLVLYEFVKGIEIRAKLLVVKCARVCYTRAKKKIFLSKWANVKIIKSLFVFNE